MPHWLVKPVHEPLMSQATKRLIFLESFLGNFLFTICMLFGVSLTTAVSAGVIMAAIPTVVALLSWIFLRERIGLLVGAAIALAALGIALFSLSKQELVAHTNQVLEPDLLHKTSWLGNLLVFGAVLCEAAYAVIGKKLTGTVSPKRITAPVSYTHLDVYKRQGPDSQCPASGNTAVDPASAVFAPPLVAAPRHPDRATGVR